MYPHQERLLRAYKRLYSLGRKRPSYDPGSDAADTLGAGFGIMQAQKSALQQKWDKQNAAYDQKAAIEKYVSPPPGAAGEAMRGGGAAAGALAAGGRQGYDEEINRQNVVNGRDLPVTPVYNPYAEAAQKLEDDKQAQMSRIGGIYSPAGLSRAAQEADANSDDRLMMRQMLGLGGSVR